MARKQAKVPALPVLSLSDPHGVTRLPEDCFYEPSLETQVMDRMLGETTVYIKTDALLKLIRKQDDEYHEDNKGGKS